MAIPVTRTKVILPRRRADLLSRQRLMEMLLNLLDYKVVVVAAPAGYGKTSLLIDFAHKVEIPACWYSLDTLDLEPQRFIAHFIASIQQQFPTFGKHALAALESANQSELDLDYLVGAIVNDAFENIREHFLLVLDDYHLVNEKKEISYFISRFIQEVDESCHLILSSRALLTLPDMPLLVARSMISGLSFEELAFQTEEIQSLVLQNYHLTMPNTAAEELAKETEGWITGLLLSAQTMAQGMTDRLRVARVSGVNLYDYLAQQVLDLQPAEVRAFLLRSSILEEFDVRLCEEVFGPSEEWGWLFESIQQSNLFVLPVGDEGSWLRYHHLFRDFLQARLEREDPEEKETISRRLAGVYARREEWEKVYVIYQRLGDCTATASMIEQAGPSLVKSGRLSTLAEWIDALPEGMLDRRPSLLSLRGVADVVRGQVDRGIELLNQAETAQRAQADLPGLANTLARRAIARRFQGRYQDSYQDVAEALDVAEHNPGLRAVRAEALRGVGICLYQFGQASEAIERLRQSLEAFAALEDRQNVALVLMDLGMAQMGVGQYRRALANYQKALGYWQEANNTLNQANLLNNLGVLHHLMGDYEQAGSALEEALACARQKNYARMEAYVLCSIGDLYSDLDAAEAAIDAYTQAREISRRIEFKSLLFYTDLAIAAQYRLNRDFSLAHQFLQTAQQYISGSDGQFEKGQYQSEAGRLCLAEGDVKLAAAHLENAAQLLEKGELQAEAAQAHLYTAEALHRQRRNEEALDHLKRAFDLAASLDSRFVLVIAGQEAKGVLALAKDEPHRQAKAAELLKEVLQFEASIPSLRKRIRSQATAVPFGPPKLTIQTFGRAQVERDGRPVNVPEWQNQKRVREFFFYLLAHPQGLTKEEIGLVFWPESSPSQLKLQFKNLIYKLRCALGQDIIVFEEDRYSFNHLLDYQYDVETFLSSIEQAQRARSTQEEVSAYRMALGVYKGLYLLEAEGAWVETERERLRQMFLEAALTLSRLCLETGEYGAALETCQRILVEDQCMEEAHRLAMRVFAALGNRAAITRQYERCRAALQKEIDAYPSPQTVSLYETLIH